MLFKFLTVVTCSPNFGYTFHGVLKKILDAYMEEEKLGLGRKLGKKASFNSFESVCFLRLLHQFSGFSYIKYRPLRGQNLCVHFVPKIDI